MRPINARDLPRLFRQLRVPAPVARPMLHGLGGGLLGDYDTYGQGGGTGTYLPETNEDACFMVAGPQDATQANAALQPNDAPGYDGIFFTVTNYRVGKGSVLSAYPANINRVLLVIQNQHATDPLCVNFENYAQIQVLTVSGSPVTQANGIIIEAGGNMFIDRYCTTGTVYIQGLNDTNAAILQGTRGAPAFVQNDIATYGGSYAPVNAGDA